MSPNASPLPVDCARLRLRALQDSDLARYQAYRGDPEVAGWQGWQVLSTDEARDFLREMAALPFCATACWHQIAIADRDSDALLGNIGLRRLDEQGGAVLVGITLARGAQGRGLAAEALQAAVALVFEHTTAARVEAVADTRNAPAMRLLAGCGFVPVASLPASFRGEPCVERHHVRHRVARLPARVRAATARDAAAVAEVLIAARRERMPFVPWAHGDDDLRAWVASDLVPAGGVAVAELDGRVVGVLAVSRHDGAGWIDQLYVHPAFAGGRIGSALLAYALSRLAPPLRLHTFQANTHARGFYERHGFQAIAFGDGSGNEEGAPDILFERRA